MFTDRVADPHLRAHTESRPTASAAADGNTGLVLDTSRVTFCNSGFLAVLEWWPRRGRRLRLPGRDASPARRRVGTAAGPAGPDEGGHVMTFVLLTCTPMLAAVLPSALGAARNTAPLEQPAAPRPHPAEP